jgi:hypothetical protein
MYSRRFDLSRWRISKDQERQPIREGRVMLTRIAECLIDLSDVRHVITDRNPMHRDEFEFSVVVTYKNGQTITVAQNIPLYKANDIVKQIHDSLQGEAE